MTCPGSPSTLAYELGWGVSLSLSLSLSVSLVLSLARPLSLVLSLARSFSLTRSLSEYLSHLPLVPVHAEGCVIGWGVIGYRTYMRSIGWGVIELIGIAPLKAASGCNLGPYCSPMPRAGDLAWVPVHAGPLTPHVLVEAAHSISSRPSRADLRDFLNLQGRGAGNHRQRIPSSSNRDLLHRVSFIFLERSETGQILKIRPLEVDQIDAGSFHFPM